MARTGLLASCLIAGGLLLQGANAQVMTADVFLPLAGGDADFMSVFEASVVTTEGQTTVFAMSCTDGPCNPIAGGTGTVVFTAAPDTYIYHATYAGGLTADLRCTLKGCPSISEVKCVDSAWSGTSTEVDIRYLTFSERMPLSLNHEVPEPTPIVCPTTSVRPKAGTAKTGTGVDSTDGPKETGAGGEDGAGEGSGSGSESESGSGSGSSDESEGGEEGGDGGSAALANTPMMGLVAGAVVAAAGMVL